MSAFLLRAVVYESHSARARARWRRSSTWAGFEVKLHPFVGRSGASCRRQRRRPGLARSAPARLSKTLQRPSRIATLPHQDLGSRADWAWPAS